MCSSDLVLAVVAPVRQDVPDRLARLRGRPDHLHVIAIGEHLAAAAPRAIAQRGVDVPGRRDRETLHPEAMRHLVLGLDHQVHVRALQRDVNDAEPLAKRCGDGGVAQRLIHLASPQASDLRCHSHHHVQCVIRLEVRSGLMAFAGSRTLGLASGTAPLPTTAEQILLDMPLPWKAPLRLRRRHGWLIIMHTPHVN